MPTWKQALRAVSSSLREEILPDRVKADGTLYISCPFHDEKSGSCVLRSGNGSAWYVCYGCRARGSITDFLAWFGLDLADIASTTDDPRQEKLL